MNAELIIVDDFYNNPTEVRATALSSDFSVAGNFPGRRTTPYMNDSVKQIVQGILGPFGGKVTYWGDHPDAGNYTGSFQYTTKDDKSWVHCDNFNTWAAVCYLTPGAPHTAGTGLFTHKELGFSKRPEDDPAMEKKMQMDGADPSKWYLTDVVANKFNRLVLYRGDRYHCSLDYFGEDKFTGRLFQTFFISTEH